jgi:hypothetical protein
VTPESAKMEPLEQTSETAIIAIATRTESDTLIIFNSPSFKKTSEQQCFNPLASLMPVSEYMLISHTYWHP